MNSIKPKILNFWNILRLFHLRTYFLDLYLSLNILLPRFEWCYARRPSEFSDFEILWNQNLLEFLLNFGYKHLFGTLVVFLGPTAVTVAVNVVTVAVVTEHLKMFTMPTLLYNTFQTKWNKFYVVLVLKREFEW